MVSHTTTATLPGGARRGRPPRARHAVPRRGAGGRAGGSGRQRRRARGGTVCPRQVVYIILLLCVEKPEGALACVFLFQFYGIR